MKKRNEIPLWTQEEPDICRFCAFANIISANETIYCEKKKKFTEEENTCRKFKYDILKKTFKRRKAQTTTYNKEQFEI